MLSLCLLLGFIAWIFPVISMMSKKHPRLTAPSLAFCAASLYFALYNTNLLVRKGDWAAIEDTFVGVLFGATVLVAVTAILNAAALIRKKKNP